MDTFHALADPTRRNILELLANNGQLAASDIYTQFKMSPPAISQHLKVLRDTKLVYVEKRAQQRIYTINPQAMQQLDAWLQEMRKTWEERLDRLEDVFKKEKTSLRGGDK